MCHSRSCVYLWISAVRKLDRHPSVSQHTGRYLCAHPELDLSVFIPRKHTVQHFARAWQGYPHHADQPGWCRHPHYICFRRNPPHWTECLPLGHAGQPDPDLCARIFLSVIMHLNMCLRSEAERIFFGKADIRNPLSLLAHERSRFATCQWELLTPTDISIPRIHRLVLYALEAGGKRSSLRSFSEDFSQTFHRFHDHTARDLQY